MITTNNSIQSIASEKNLSLLLSAAEVGTGLLLMAKCKSLSGGTLFLAGLAAGSYSIKTSGGEFRRVEWIKQMALGAIPALVSGGIMGLVAKQATNATKIFCQIFSSTMANTISEATAQYFAKKPLSLGTTLYKYAKAGTVNCIIQALAGKITGAILLENGNFVGDLCKKVISGSFKSAAGCASSKVVINLDEGKEADKDVLESSLSSAFIGGAVSAAEFYNTLNDPESALNKKMDELNDLAKKNLERNDWLSSKNFDTSELENMSPGSKKWILSQINLHRNTNNMDTIRLQQHTLAEWEKAFKILSEITDYHRNVDRIFEEGLNIYKESHLVSPALLEKQKLRALLGSNPVTRAEFVDCSYRDLINHVVLVHALMRDPIVNSLPEEKLNDYFSLSNEEQLLFCLKSAITPEGLVGHHLDLRNRAFSGPLQRRPHMHWFWNQLVQANVGGNWEDGPIAILEPLSTFEESSDQKPFGLAAYDTLCIGPHLISEQARILVPESILDSAKTAYPKYKDQFIGYNPTKKLRTTVIEELKIHFPKTWHVCDDTGELIGYKPEYTREGYKPCTYIKRDDGKIILLFKNGGVRKEDQSSTYVKDIVDSKRFMGLHNHCKTYLVDGLNNHTYFNSLAEFKENPRNIQTKMQFAGSIQPENLINLGVFAAFELYRDLMEYDPETGVQQVADYYIDIAMQADLTSLFYKYHPQEELDLTALDFKKIFDSIRPHMVNLMDEMDQCLKQKKAEEALNIFHEYSKLLKQAYQKRLEAKQLALKYLNDGEENVQQGLHPLETTFFEEWKKIAIPNTLQFDMGKHWPFSDELKVYVDKIMDTLPSDEDSLKSLYKQLKPHEEMEKRTKYQRIVIRDIIRWILQEGIYHSIN